MKLFYKILEDIRNGENLDVYVTIFLAIVIATLDILDLTSDDFIAPLILATLAVLAFSSLYTRQQNEEIINKLDLPYGNLFLDKWPDHFQSNLKLAQSVLIVGVSLNRTIDTYYKIFEEKIKQGDQIKILLVRPGGVSVKLAASQMSAPNHERHINQRIQESLQILCNLYKYESSKFEIRVIDRNLSYYATLLNHDTTNTGMIYMQLYSYKPIDPGFPKHVFYQDDGAPYAHFSQEIMGLWNDGTPCTCHESELELGTYDLNFS
ncbi:MAG: hypothetical protein ACPGWR_19545 [Ardenticatenaceae bacterium]